MATTRAKKKLTIRERRMELGLTQTELGEKVGLIQEAVSMLERGKVMKPSFHVVQQIAKVLDVSLDELAV